MQRDSFKFYINQKGEEGAHSYINIHSNSSNVDRSTMRSKNLGPSDLVRKAMLFTKNSIVLNDKLKSKLKESKKSQTITQPLKLKESRRLSQKNKTINSSIKVNQDDKKYHLDIQDSDEVSSESNSIQQEMESSQDEEIKATYLNSDFAIIKKSKTRCLLSKRDKRKTYIDLIVMISAVFSAFFDPIMMAFYPHSDTFVILKTIDVLSDLIYVVDMLVIFRTTYTDSVTGQEVTDLK